MLRVLWWRSTVAAVTVHGQGGKDGCDRRAGTKWTQMDPTVWLGEFEWSLSATGDAGWCAWPTRFDGAVICSAVPGASCVLFAPLSCPVGTRKFRARPVSNVCYSFTDLPPLGLPCLKTILGISLLLYNIHTSFTSHTILDASPPPSPSRPRRSPIVATISQTPPGRLGQPQISITYN